MARTRQGRSSSDPQAAEVTPKGQRTTATHSWVALSILLGLYTFAYLDRYVLTLLVDPISADLGVSDFEISLLVGMAFILSFSLAAIPIGWAVDRVSRRLIILAGVAVWSVSTLLSGASRSYAHLLACRLGVGAGEAALNPAAYSLLGDLFPRHRLSRVLSIYSLGALVGGAISFIAGGLIIGRVLQADAYPVPVLGMVKPWQIVFFLAAMPGLLLGGLVLFIREPARESPLAAASTPGFWAHARLHRRFYLAHLGGFGMLNIMAAGYITWLPTYLLRTFHWPVEQVGLLFGSVKLIAGAVGMLAGGFICDVLYRRGVQDAHFRYAMASALILCVAGATACLARDVHIVIAAIVVSSAMTPFIAIAAASLQLATPAAYRGRASALFLLAFNLIGSGLGPSIVGAITDFVLHDKAKIGVAMALSFAVFAPIALVCFGAGLNAMRLATRGEEARLAIV